MKLGSREKIKLKTDKHLFIRRWGISEKSTKSILDYFTLQGAIPEPIRVAKLAARAASLTRKR